MQSVRLGSLEVSKVILGGNPISGFSHLSSQTDMQMLRYFTSSKVKSMLKNAVSLGVDTFLGRCDQHVTRLMMEYRDEGGNIKWIAQSCPEFVGIERSIKNARDGGASAIYIHGGVMDHLSENNKLHEAVEMIKKMKDTGLPVGVAGHMPKVIHWAHEELDLDFFMCSYYNPFSRADSPAKATAITEEVYDDSDRAAMVQTITGLSKPAIHYKVLAAGRNNPRDAFSFVKEHLRPTDAVCIGIYDENNPGMLREDLEMLGF